MIDCSPRGAFVHLQAAELYKPFQTYRCEQKKSFLLTPVCLIPAFYCEVHLGCQLSCAHQFFKPTVTSMV